jgi:hypothetical protein
LFEQVELLRQAIFLYAVGCSPFISSLLSTPLRIFSVERYTAGTFPVERSIPDPVAGLQILYREQERRKRVLGWRRAHKEPFEEQWQDEAISGPLPMPSSPAERIARIPRLPGEHAAGKIWVEQWRWNNELGGTVLNCSVVFSTFCREGDRIFYG